MGLRTLKGVDVKNKVVLLRIDLNSPFFKGKILESERFKAHASTIRFLKKKKAKIVIISHQGRPGSKDFIGLKQHAKILNKYTKVKFVDSVIGKKAVSAILSLKSGEAILLDNIRMVNGEFSSSSSTPFVRVLSSLANIYVQDAFSVTHRKQASITVLPEVMESYAGPVLFSEFNALNKIKYPKKPIVYVLGGIKVGDYKRLVNKARIQKATILSAGTLKGPGVIMPLDFVGEKKKDIGEKTIGLYREYIHNARTIFMKGVLGYTEDERYKKGTISILVGGALLP